MALNNLFSLKINEITFSILSYSICSSTLLLSNKIILFYLPSPSIISLIQILSSLFFLFLLSSFFSIQIDKLEINKVKKYLIYVLAFTISRYSNMKSLENLNIEVVIIFRSCIPLTVSFIEYYYMGRELPSYKSLLSLFLISIGAILYCISDSKFMLHGITAYSWVFLYFIILTFEMTYCKTLISSAKMSTNWGPVYYCNTLAVIPMILFGYLVGDFDHFTINDIKTIPLFGLLVLFFSCIVGTFIGYTSWLCVRSVSATSYALVGVINKFLTVLLNILFWDQHSTPLGLFAVCLCLGASLFYEQAPIRQKSP